MNGMCKMAMLDNRTLGYGGHIVLGVLLIIVSSVLRFWDPAGIIANTSATWGMVVYLPAVFVAQEKNGLERLYGSLPLSAHDVVCGRYLFYYLNFFVMLALTLIFGVAISNAAQGVYVLASVAVAVLLFTLIAGVQLAVYFTWGTRKGALVSWLQFCILVLGFLNTVFMDQLYDFWQEILAHPLLIALFSVLASVVIGVVSYRLALSGWRKRI